MEIRTKGIRISVPDCGDDTAQVLIGRDNGDVLAMVTIKLNELREEPRDRTTMNGYDRSASREVALPPEPGPTDPQRRAARLAKQKSTEVNRKTPKPMRVQQLYKRTGPRVREFLELLIDLGQDGGVVPKSLLMSRLGYSKEDSFNKGVFGALSRACRKFRLQREEVIYEVTYPGQERGVELVGYRLTELAKGPLEKARETLRKATT